MIKDTFENPEDELADAREMLSLFEEYFPEDYSLVKYEFQKLNPERFGDKDDETDDDDELDDDGIDDDETDNDELDDDDEMLDLDDAIMEIAWRSKFEE